MIAGFVPGKNFPGLLTLLYLLAFLVCLQKSPESPEEFFLMKKVKNKRF